MDFELKWSGATVKENCISEEVGYLILMKKWFTFIYSDKAISCWNIIFLKRWHKIFTIIQLIKSLNRFNLYSKIIISKNLINVISRISNKTKQIILPILIIIKSMALPTQYNSIHKHFNEDKQWDNKLSAV